MKPSSVLIAGGLAAAMLAPASALAQGISLEQLNGAAVEFTIDYATQVRNRLGPFSGVTHVVGRLQISGNALQGSVSRTYLQDGTPRASATANPAGQIGKPGEAKAGGHYLWLYDGSTLTLLRTFAAGGLKMTISFRRGSGLTCSVRAPNMKEAGAGNTRRDSMVGGEVEIVSMTQTASTCRVSGGR